MTKKYKLTDETKVFMGAIVHRIEALRDFSGIKKGDLGGWVEKEDNLSHDGDCWVDDDSCVLGESHVTGDKLVYFYTTITEGVHG